LSGSAALAVGGRIWRSDGGASGAGVVRSFGFITTEADGSTAVIPDGGVALGHVELHVYAGAFHGSDLVSEARVTRAHARDQLEALRAAFAR
jgi:hypothetical protein